MSLPSTGLSGPPGGRVDINKIESKKVEQSVNKIKEAVDNEVKEKFTKSTDPKDIFNELFGESKK